MSMPDTPTPAQVAYEAYRDYVSLSPWHVILVVWGALLPGQQGAWEAAAEAVRLAYKEELAQAWAQGKEGTL